jgi:O-antigen/teichoic acid export membrane protein
MLSFSGWNLVGTFSQLLKGQGVNMLLNVFFGTVVNAARAVAFQVNAAITSFSNNVAMSFQPQMVNSYASNEHSRLMNLFFAESRICFVLMAFLITPLVLETDYVLGLWLGDSVPPQTRIFAILVLADSLVCTLEMPCTQVAYAVGRIRDYKVVPSLVSLMLLPAAWAGLGMGMSAVSVFVMTIVFSSFQVLASMTMLHRIFSYSVADYLRHVLLPCIVFLILNAVVPMLVSHSMESSWQRLVATCSIEVIIGGLLAWFIVMDKREKEMLTGYAHKLLRR